jgi:AraC-like DNA-binding protein
MSTPKRALSILNPSRTNLAEEEDAHDDRFIRIVTMARRQGASIRSLAKCFNVSKSTMGRLVQMIETLEASHLGQRSDNSLANSTAAQLPSVPNRTVPDD